MPFTVSHTDGAAGLREAAASFLTAASALDELALLESSRCVGWSRLEVVDHVLAGWRELFAGLADRTDGPASVDAASYWTDYAEQVADADPVLVVMEQRRHSLAHARPAAAVAAIVDVGRQLDHVVAALPEGFHAFQGHVLTSGDLLATWAVETVVHQLDLDAETDVPPSALRLAHRTAEHVTDVRDRLPPPA